MKFPFVLRFTKTMLIIAALTASASATTMVPANLAHLSEGAVDAFVIRITEISDNETSGQPCQKITGIISETVFGNTATSQTYSWNQFKLGQNLKLAGMPQYEIGKEYMIFLSGPGRGPGFKCPIGLGQGAFLVTRQGNRSIVRNAFMNSTLNHGLATNRVTRDMVQSKAAARGMNAAAVQAEVEVKSRQLQSGPNTSLDALKETARFLHDKKMHGDKPSQDYRTTATTRLMH